MPNLTGPKQLFHSNTLVVDTTRRTELGAFAYDESGNEFIYLQGTASTTAGDWVVYDENFATTRLTANEVGPVAVAPTAVVTGEFGWFQIKGVTQANTDTVVADAQLYIDGTAGRADDLSVGGDLIVGASSMTAAVSNKATCYIIYPQVTDTLGGTTGGVSGPASSSDNAVARWSGTGGDTLKNSGLVLNDLTGSVTITSTNAGNATFAVNQDLTINATAQITGTATILRTLTLSQNLAARGNSTTIIETTNPNNVTLALNQSLTVDATATISTFGATVIDDASAAAVRTTIGAVIGTNVQAWDAQLDDIAALGVTASTFIVADGANWLSRTAAQARPDLGLGSIATQAASNVSITGGSVTGITDITVADGGTGTSAISASAVVLGGETDTGILRTVSGLGTSGQVLTSNGGSSLPTWQAAGGGGGVSTAEVNRWIDAADFSLPDTDFAARAKYGTTWVFTVLDYDATTAEAAQYKFQIPRGVKASSTTTVDVFWVGATGFASATSSAVVWAVTTRPITATEAFDANTTPAQATATVVSQINANNNLGTGIVVVGETGTAWTAADLLEIRVARLPANASDNFTNDARLLGVNVRIQA